MAQTHARPSEWVKFALLLIVVLIGIGAVVYASTPPPPPDYPERLRIEPRQ
jgi:uncharacterized membrane protein